MTQKFTATRTMLANAMATAGAELLEYMGTAGALAAIPNTDPQQYVVAGTLQIIGKLLPAVDGTPAVQAQAELTDERIIEIAAENGLKVRTGQGAIAFARAIEREVRSAARVQARNEALEEAARMSDSSGHHWSGAPAFAFFELAGAIRALKAEAPAASKEGDA